jgi:hypothetical protein
VAEDIDVDALMGEIEAPRAERAMEGEPAAAEEAPAPVWNGEEWAFEVNGRKIVPDSRDKITQWMSQGFNYAQRAGELNKQKAEWEKKFSDYESRLQGYTKYDQVNAYAQQNPQWWQHVETQWNAAQQPQIDPNVQQAIKPLQDELGGIKEFVSQWQAEKNEQVAKQADQALESEVGEIRKQYPNIDLTSRDESGKPLELRVWEHGAEIGTTSFRAAFRTICSTSSRSLALPKRRRRLRAKARFRPKRGIIGQSPTPQRKPELSPYRKGKSWDNLAQEALAELGIT